MEPSPIPGPAGEVPGHPVPRRLRPCPTTHGTPSAGHHTPLWLWELRPWVGSRRLWDPPASLQGPRLHKACSSPQCWNHHLPSEAEAQLPVAVPAGSGSSPHTGPGSAGSLSPFSARKLLGAVCQDTPHSPAGADTQQLLLCQMLLRCKRTNKLENSFS